MSNKVFTARVGETLLISFDFSKDLELPWRPDYQYSLSEFITIGELVYECTNAGKTGKELPENLSTTIGATQDDGTVEWTVRDFSTSGSDTISTKAVTADTGITIDASAITKSVYVSVTFTAVSVGKRVITCQVVTAAGETLISKLSVLVK